MNPITIQLINGFTIKFIYYFLIYIYTIIINFKNESYLMTTIYIHHNTNSIYLLKTIRTKI